jgi:phosphatidylserine decarboxylase
MRHNSTIFLFKIIPKGLISRLTGFVARLYLPGFVLNPVIKKYCNAYKVKRNEIDYPAHGFRTLDKFFTRKLKPGVHKINAEKDSVVSPVDARIDQFGTINRGSLIQAKGIEYKLGDLIPSKMANEFAGGSFITLYLSPADYHRIHSPASGSIIGYSAIPGKLFPVKDIMVKSINGLFTINERIISYIKNKNGLIAVCKVGAMNVGRITLSYSDSGVETNKFFRKRREFFYSQMDQPEIKKGDELGVFHLGSTVIIIFQKRKIKFADIKTGQTVRVGEKIASYI